MNKLSRYKTVLILLMIFLLPLVIAFLISQHNTFSTTNYGHWAPHDMHWKFSKKSKTPWKLLLNINGQCDKSCINELDALGRVRLAMGRKAYDLSIYLILPELKYLDKELEQVLVTQGIQVEISQHPKDNRKNAFTNYPIILVDAKDNAVLMYRFKFEPKKIFNDMNKLIQ